jgi:hypothetical protein
MKGYGAAESEKYGAQNSVHPINIPETAAGQLPSSLHRRSHHLRPPPRTAAHSAPKLKAAEALG